MKLSKTVQWSLTIGITAIILIALGVTYSRQQAEQSRLNADIAQAQQDFTKRSAEKKDLERRFSQANSRVATIQDEFHASTESIEICDALFEIADDTNVELTSLSSSPPGGEKLSGITYRAFSLSLTVKGKNIAALLNFTNKLSQSFPDATIGSVGISVGGEEESTLSLRLKVYAYESE